MVAIAPRAVRLRYAVFVALALLINVIDGMLTRSAGDARRQLILAIASCFDVVLVVVALYYGLLVRSGVRTKASMIIVTLLAMIRAGFLFPSGSVKMIIAGICELGFIGIVMMYVQQVRKTNRESEADPVEAIRTTIRTILPLPIAVNALAAELAIVYYAFSWWAKPHNPVNSQAFTNYAKIGRADLLSVLPIVCILEIIPIHLLLQLWNSAVAWAATGLSAYALIWLVGLARSFPLRPTLVARDYVYLRYGLIFQLHVPRPLIACSRRAVPEDSQFAVPRKTEPTHYIEFVREVTAEGLFGFRRRLTRVALTFDDQPAFERALTQTSE